MSDVLRPYDDLTLPEPGSTSARQVLSLAIRRLLGDLKRLPSRHAPSLEGRAELRAFRTLVAELLVADPGAVASLLRHPTVAVHLRVLRALAPGAGARGGPALRASESERVERAEAGVAAFVCTSLFELAVADSLPRPFRVTRFPERVLCLPGRMALDVPERVRALIFDNGTVTFESDAGTAALALDGRPNGPLHTPYHEVEGPILLALVDNNPVAMVEAHPDKGGNRVDLGGRAPAQWTGALRDALGVVATHLPDLRREIDLFVQQIVPVGFHAETHLSASYREAIGTIYTSLHPQPMTMVEAMVHELSHNKLNALFELDPILENGSAPLHSSPVRPDPRPLHGVLLAVHAFLPLARLYERMGEERHPWAERPQFRRRFAEIIRKNDEGTRVLLEHAQPTLVGRAVLDEMARWNAHFVSLGAAAGDA